MGELEELCRFSAEDFAVAERLGLKPMAQRAKAYRKKVLEELVRLGAVR